MKRIIWFLAAAVLVSAVPALAGGDGEKCSNEVQACLGHFSAYKEKGWVGLELDTKDEAMVVKAVTTDSPASKAGFQAGDVLMALNGVKFADKSAMKAAKGEWKVGQKVNYTVLRKGSEKTLAVTLGQMPEDVFARMIGMHMISDHMAAAATADAGHGH